MHTHSRRVWSLVVALVLLAAHALLLYLFVEAGLSAVLGAGLAIFLAEVRHQEASQVALEALSQHGRLDFYRPNCLR